jgi:hypothetical protein
VKPLAILRFASLALIAVISVSNLASTLKRVLPTVAGSPSSICEVERQGMRFGPARRALIARNVEGTIGYVGEVPAEQMGAEDMATEEYYLAQYWLAPVVLDSRSDSYQWTVESLRANTTVGRLSEAWRTDAALGDGVFLLRRAAR